ncbi:hypothetical protein AAFF_G00253140 [Aldrovandia affinis]|uniref:Uncharacterized protein n=1 Tax=Aldrovandia affinis TaxID=143900 RepID=A0AAD7STV5_9TELE|nr:hypothetical protein AAFF_G00253140 [Aldrovandia affinis]
MSDRFNSASSASSPRKAGRLHSRIKSRVAAEPGSKEEVSAEKKNKIPFKSSGVHNKRAQRSARETEALARPPRPAARAARGLPQLLCFIS